MRFSEERAIELGKIWMKKSVDPVHDYTHAENVEKHALEVFKYFKKIDESISENMVKLAVWWHDSYKSRCKKPTLESILLEGPKSVKIFEEEVGNLISDNVRKRVSEAIRYHANPIYFILKKYSMDPLVNILVEADQIEGFRVERNRRFLKQIKNPISRALGILQCLMIPVYVRLIGRSDYIAKFKGSRVL